MRTGCGSLVGTTCPVDSACPQGGIHAQTTCTAASSAIPTPGAPRWALPTRRAPLDLRPSACCPTPLYTHIRATAWHVSHAPAHLRPIPAECTQRAPSGPSRAQVACPPLSPRTCPRFQGKDAVDRNGAFSPSFVRQRNNTMPATSVQNASCFELGSCLPALPALRDTAG